MLRGQKHPSFNFVTVTEPLATSMERVDEVRGYILTQQKVMGHTYPKYWVKTTATQATHAVGNSYQLGIL